MSEWKLSLRQPVRVAISGEAGEVIGRAEYATTPLRSYYVRLLRADGRASEDWWTEDALEAVKVESPPVPPEAC